MEENIATRLKLFIDTNGLTSSQFADMCGIPRPTLSQILSGRNKKVSDTLVKQVHSAFPDLSILWLMFGEGPVKIASSDVELGIRSHNVNSSEGLAPVRWREERIFTDENPVMTPDVQGEIENSALKALNSPNLTPNSTKNQIFESDLRIVDLQHQIENMRKNPRKVIQITIYYDDSTFETFIPKN